VLKLLAFISAIMAEVIAHYICKWLDSLSDDN